MKGFVVVSDGMTFIGLSETGPASDQLDLSHVHQVIRLPTPSVTVLGRPQITTHPLVVPMIGLKPDAWISFNTLCVTTFYEVDPTVVTDLIGYG